MREATNVLCVNGKEWGGALDPILRGLASGLEKTGFWTRVNRIVRRVLDRDVAVEASGVLPPIDAHLERRRGNRITTVFTAANIHSEEGRAAQPRCLGWGA
jgi:hypothetical protein